MVTYENLLKALEFLRLHGYPNMKVKANPFHRGEGPLSIKAFEQTWIDLEDAKTLDVLMRIGLHKSTYDRPILFADGSDFIQLACKNRRLDYSPGVSRFLNSPHGIVFMNLVYHGEEDVSMWAALCTFVRGMRQFMPS